MKPVQRQAGLKRGAPEQPQAPGMCDPTAMPWSRTDIPEFPEAARTFDLDILIKRKEAQLAPGQQYGLAWPGPAGTPGQRTDAPTQDQWPERANPAPLPNTGTTTNQDASARAAIPRARAANEAAVPHGQQPLPVPAKKQRTGPTKADWKTMDYQDTESE